VIEVTVFYGFLIRVKHPSIHKSYPEMIWMRISMIERCEVFARDTLIDEYCSREWATIDIGYIDADIICPDSCLASEPLSEIRLVWISHSGLTVDIEIDTDIGDLLYSQST
jgi:hypothetical protein